MSIGYDSAKVPAPTSVADLLKPEYKGKVALNGDPTQAGAAFGGVVMAALGSGGSADDIAPGVDFFGKLKKAGNFLPVDPTPATIESGQTPVVFDWDYLNVAQGAKLKGKVDWKTVVPANAVVGSYYVQAISKDAPHPAAARLWEEFLYSDAGSEPVAQGRRPAGARRRHAEGRHDRRDRVRRAAQGRRHAGVPDRRADHPAKNYLAANWAKTIG